MPLVQQIPQAISGLNKFRKEPLLTDGSCFLFDFSYQPECWAGGNPTANAQVNNIAADEIDPIIPLGTVSDYGDCVETAGKGLQSTRDEEIILNDDNRFTSQIWNGGAPHDWCLVVWYRWQEVSSWSSNTYFINFGGRLGYMSFGPTGFRFNGVTSGINPTGNPTGVGNGELMQLVISNTQSWSWTPSTGKNLTHTYNKPMLSLPSTGVRIERILNWPDQNPATVYRAYLEDLTISGRTPEQVMDADFNVVSNLNPRPFVATP